VIVYFGQFFLKIPEATFLLGKSCDKNWVWLLIHNLIGQIWRIFALWVIVYFNCYLKITEAANFLHCKSYVFVLTKHGVCFISADFSHGMIFEYFLQKIGKKLAFFTQNKVKLFKNLILTLVFEKNANFSPLNCRKSQKSM
jgi:hypothetical protein